MVDFSNNNGTSSVGPAQVFTIENSRNPALGSQLRQEIESLSQHFIELDDQENKILRSKKSIILELCDKFERLYEIGEYPFPVNTIGSQVIEYLRRKGHKIGRSYTYEIIQENAPQYLNLRIDREAELNSYQKVHTGQNDINFEQQKIIEAVKTLKNANLDHLTSSTFKEAVPDIYDTVQKYQNYADDNNIITFNPTEYENTAQFDSQDLDPYQETIKAPVPEQPRSSDLQQATEKMGKAFQEVGKSLVTTSKLMYEYPPDSNDPIEKQASEKLDKWTHFLLMLDEAIKGGTDRKFRRSIVQWVKIADDEESWGKHASSSMNPYTAIYKDKNGEWKEEIRKLTREQIGEKAPKAREFARVFKQTVPAFFDFLKWSETYLHPYTNALSIQLHDKLSDRSMK